ncbi:MAG: hypothetical protein V4567_06540, partial [Pseudomonadota bacterium]
MREPRWLRRRGRGLKAEVHSAWVCRRLIVFRTPYGLIQKSAFNDTLAPLATRAVPNSALA